MRVKTIDINALEWFDRANGNSYFAATVTVNYSMKSEKRFILPFQYGYGEHYKEMAAQLLEKNKVIEREKNTALWRYCDEQKIVLRYNKESNCKKRDLMQIS